MWHVTLAGRTDRMAKYVAEDVRFAGHLPVVNKVLGIKSVQALGGSDE
jgi:hypothetical protein